MNKPVYLLALISIPIILLVSGCRATKIETGELKRIKPKELIRSVGQSELDYQIFNAKTKIKIESKDDKTSFKGGLRIIKDSAIWMSITPLLGLEAARVLITPDSIKIIDRIHKEYYLKEFSYIEETFQAPVTFEQLQALMTGNLLIKNHKNASSFVNGNHYHLISEDGDISSELKIRPSDFAIMEMMLLNVKENKKIEVVLDEYKNIDNQIFSHKRDVKVSAEEIYKLSLDFSRVRINQPVHINFIIPSNYEMAH